MYTVLLINAKLFTGTDTNFFILSFVKISKSRNIRYPKNLKTMKRNMKLTILKAVKY